MILAGFTHLATRHRLSGFISARSPPARPAERSGVKWQSPVRRHALTAVTKTELSVSSLRRSSCDDSVGSVKQPSWHTCPTKLPSVQPRKKTFSVTLQHHRQGLHRAAEQAWAGLRSAKNINNLLLKLLDEGKNSVATVMFLTLDTIIKHDLSSS